MTLQWHRFCRELSEKWEEAAAKKGIRWESNVPPDLREVRSDARLLRLVLDNLIDNAVKFTAEGGHIEFNCRRVASELIIEVADSGCGIPKEDQERVFERFYQVTSARTGTGSLHTEMRGTGLGLAIVRHAVGAMRGRVKLESEPGVGTRVTVIVPQPE